MKSKYLVLVDAGHGGNHPETGQYMTSPLYGKFYKFLKPNGQPDFEIREGVINRLIALKFMQLAKKQGIACQPIYHPYQDTPLQMLAMKANHYYKLASLQGMPCILLSFHSNAFGNQAEGQGEAPRGFSVWTTPGLTEADRLAELWYKKHAFYTRSFHISMRPETSDQDFDWEANFYLLFHTAMPAVLCENLFFTNREDAKLLMDVVYQEASAQAALETVKTYFQR